MSRIVISNDDHLEILNDFKRGDLGAQIFGKTVDAALLVEVPKLKETIFGRCEEDLLG